MAEIRGFKRFLDQNRCHKADKSEFTMGLYEKGPNRFGLFIVTIGVF